jgi:hypothetical protein
MYQQDLLDIKPENDFMMDDSGTYSLVTGLELLFVNVRIRQKYQ